MRVLLILCLLASVISAQQKQDNTTSALINEALDKQVNLKLDGVLPQVLHSIEDKTGVRIAATDDVYDLLPWGEQTNVKIKVENKTLREALTAVCRKLGLLWELGRFEVTVKPMPALSRLGRRATISELQSLELLRTTSFAGAKSPMTIQAILTSIDKQLAGIKSPSIALDIRPGNPSDPQAGFIQLDKTVNVPRDSNLSILLEDLARESDATWYPWGTKIVVVPKQQQIRMLLDKSITAHFNGTDIAGVIDQFAAASGATFQIEPGAFQRVPPQYRSIRLDLENATIRQALEEIRGVTGLDYTVRPDGVYVWNQNPNPTLTTPASVDPVVAIIQSGNGVQVMLRESEVPPDVKAFLAQKRQDTIAQLRQRMKEEGFVAPTTQPTTSRP
ncbi:MAG TPA: STN domain-containing protein [Tepidisphaeraceae bacterium]|jgi:hypothetical protein|nr:STN domain-containing protein [Tepidisphaeraceae bacterium]